MSPIALSFRAVIRSVEQLEGRSLLSAGQGTADGPPEWAAAQGYREERTAAPVPGEQEEVTGGESASPEKSHAPPGQSDDGAGPGSGRGEGRNVTGMVGDGSIQSGGEAGESGTPLEPDVTAPEIPTAAASSSATTEQDRATPAFWFPPVVSPAGDGLTPSPTAMHDSHGSPPLAAADPGIRLADGSGSRESSVMVGVIGEAADAPASQAGAGAAPADGEPTVYPGTAEDIADLPFGPAVESPPGVGAIGAAILNRFAPPDVLAQAAQAVEVLAVRLEEGSGEGWESWALAAGLAAAAGEVARRQFRRRPAVRPVPPSWDTGGRDVF
jgi:hypothetical protein